MTKLYERGFPFLAPVSGLTRIVTTTNDIAQLIALENNDRIIYSLQVSGNALHWAETSDGRACTRNDILIPAGTTLYVKPGNAGIPPGVSQTINCSYITANNGQNGTVCITEHTNYDI